MAHLSHASLIQKSNPTINASPTYYGQTNIQHMPTSKISMKTPWTKYGLARDAKHPTLSVNQINNKGIRSIKLPN